MSDWIDGSKTGDYAFTDSDGIRYYRGRTCNVHATPEEALRAGRLTLRSRSPVYVWRTTDGLYLWTAITDPKTPELDGAERVTVQL